MCLLAFSEYHASSSVSGAFMIRKDKWKYIYYVGFEPELFNLAKDPEETNDLSQNKDYKDILNELKFDLYQICNPEEMNELAFKDQDLMIKNYGGIEAASKLGATGATPPPKGWIFLIFKICEFNYIDKKRNVEVSK